jgi:hypothetical protein
MQVTNDELERKVIAFQNFPCEENEREVAEAIKHLAGHLITYYAAKMDLTTVRFDDVICHALERLWHFDPVNYRWAKDPAASVLRQGSLPNGSLTPSPHAIPVVPTVLAR